MLPAVIALMAGILILAACIGHKTPEEDNASSGVSWYNNVSSVENYSYTYESSRFENVLLLKDCLYDFWNDLNIPGMPSTRTQDVADHIIYSEDICPQGVCLTEEFIMLTAYSADTSYLGEIMIFDRSNCQYLATFGLSSKSHLGGLTYDGENVWICSSSNDSIMRISYDFIELMAWKNTGGVIDARGLVDVYSVSNTPSCITWYDGRLWVGTHNILFDAEVFSYYYNDKTNQLETLSSFAIPAQVQGIAFSEDGKVYVSTSYGRKRSSYLKVYDSVEKMAADTGNPKSTIEMPPCSEEICYEDGKLYILFESAGMKYLEGTDGNGQSPAPIDKLLILLLDDEGMITMKST